LGIDWTEKPGTKSTPPGFNVERRSAMNATKRVFLALIFPVLFFLATAFSAAAVEVGEIAPDFELYSTKGGKLKLSSLRGKNVLIQFYVLDFTPT
jgi:hypothetical protein